jgi:tetratricopeptide (TPR) repeat protein
VKALTLLDELSASNSDILFYSARYGALLPNLATAYKNIGQPKQAIQCYLRATEISRRLVKAYPDLPKHKYDLAIDLRRLAGLQRSETPNKSIETLWEGIDLHEQLLAQTPNNPMYRYTLAIALYEQAVALTFLPETFQRSSDLFARSMKIQGQLIRDDTQQSSEYMIGYTMAATHYFMLLEKQNLFEDAIPISRSLIEMWEEFDNSRGQIEVIRAIAGTRLSLSRQLYLSGNSPDGLIEFRNAISACLEARQYQVIYNKATQVATFTSISPGRWKYAAFASLIASSVHAQSDGKLTLQDRENVLSANLSLATMLFRQLIETKYFTLADNRKRLNSESFYDDTLMDDFRHVGIK